MHVFTIGKSNALTTRQLLLSLIKTGKEFFLSHGIIYIILVINILHNRPARTTCAQPCKGKYYS
jgi:hypothetical protein